MFLLAWALEKHPVDECERLYSKFDVVCLKTPKEQGVRALTVPMGDVDCGSIQEYKSVLHKLA